MTWLCPAGHEVRPPSDALGRSWCSTRDEYVASVARRECGTTWPAGRHLDHPEPGEHHVCVLEPGHPPFCCCWCGAENEPVG